MAHQFTASYLEDSVAVFRHYKRLADRAMAQLSDDQLFTALDPESNSVAVIVKHLAGNMRSRWTNLLTSDGEKPDRHRDSEFLDPPATRDALLAAWEQGWAILFATLASLNERDLGWSITIRGEEHSVMQAINRGVAHAAYHCGQIIFLAKHLKGPHWQTLSIPRGQSAEFNQRLSSGKISQR